MTKRNGFTLIEIMVVIVILGVLAAVGVPKLFGMMAKAKAAELSSAAGIYIHLQEVNLHHNHYVGTWKDIGYAAPGNGNSENFGYVDCIKEKLTINSGSASLLGWKASNRSKLNECTEHGSWIIAIDPVNESEAHYRRTISSTSCAALTADWTVENIDAGACTGP